MKKITGLKEEILLLAAVSGELSDTAVRRLHPSYGYISNCLSGLREDNLIRKISEDKMTGYKLTVKGKHFVSQAYPDRFAGFVTGGVGTDKVRLDPMHRQRYHRIAETVVMMHRLGIAVLPGDKPPLYTSPLAVDRSLSQPCFYLSHEVKDMGENGIKINNARFRGLLRSGGGDYLLYNTCSISLKWEEMSEYRALELLQSELHTTLRPIMMGHTMDVAYDLLTGNAKKNSTCYKVTGILPCMHYVPFNENGEFLMRMGFLSGCLHALKTALLKDSVQKPNSDWYCDGFTVDGKPILYACDFDMQRIYSYRNKLDMDRLGGVVYCFDFQVAVLERYFEGLGVVFKVLEKKKVEEKFAASPDVGW